MTDENQTAELSPSQRWIPAPGKRAKAREIVRLKTDSDGYPAVVYAPFWINCGYTGTSTIRVEGFRAWIRKMRATCEVISNE